MACSKCGSSWVTQRGKDCVSCPYCSKVTRSHERKRGRWVDQTQVTSCKHCGCEFEEKIVGSARRSYCSESCRKAHKSVWRREWGVSYRKGVRKQQQNKLKKPRPVCKQCGKHFKRQAGGNSANIYCSQACFFTARASGLQPWDRTSLFKAYWHRGGQYASAPSVKLMARIEKAHRLIEIASNAFEVMAERELARPQCEVCSKPCNDGASRFCSYQCAKKWRGRRPCEVCSITVPNAKAHGKCRCRHCRAKAKTEANRRQKKKYGRNHRQRARHHGVRYVPVEVKAIYERDGWICQICHKMCRKFFAVRKKDGRPHPRSPTIDHIKSMADGGHHEPSNLQLACFECNTKKGSASRGQLRLRLA